MVSVLAPHLAHASYYLLLHVAKHALTNGNPVLQMSFVLDGRKRLIVSVRQSIVEKVIVCCFFKILFFFSMKSPKCFVPLKYTTVTTNVIKLLHKILTKKNVLKTGLHYLGRHKNRHIIITDESCKIKYC